MIEPYSDSPGTSRQDDRLRRGPFVDSLLRLLLTISSGNDSTVVGLVGPWGSGKTQILNELRPALRGYSIKVVNFTPWAAEDATGLQAEFHAALLEAFPGNEELKKRAVRVLKRSIPLAGAIPYAGPAVSDFAQSFLQDEGWKAAFDKYGIEIRKAGVKIVVVVDDLDRLQPSELLHVLKTIRLLGRLPRVQYLLAYDQEALVSSLKQGLRSNATDALGYLEKVVQYPLPVPPAQVEDLSKILEEQVSSIFQSSTQNFFSGSSERFWTFHERHMVSRLHTVRKIKRFGAQANVYFELVQGEVDAADFLILTFLRLEFPSIYIDLRFWKSELVGLSERSEAPTSRIHWEERFGERGVVGSDSVRQVWEMISELFPAISGGSAGGGRARASNPDYFDRYFLFAVPISDVSDKAVERDADLIRSGERVTAPYSETFDHDSPAIAKAAIEKAIRITETVGDPMSHRNIIEYISHAMGRHRRFSDQYDARLSALSKWLQDSLMRQSDSVAIEEWPAFLQRMDVLLVSQVVENITDHHVGTQLPEDMKTPLPDFFLDFRKAFLEIVKERFILLAASPSYTGRSKEFLDLYGIFWRTLEVDDIRRIGALLIESGTTLVELAGWFVYPGDQDGRHLRFNEAGKHLSELDIEKLEILLGFDKVVGLPLETDTRADDDLTSRRQAKAEKGIEKWRKFQKEHESREQ